MDMVLDILKFPMLLTMVMPNLKICWLSTWDKVLIKWPPIDITMLDQHKCHLILISKESQAHIKFPRIFRKSSQKRLEELSMFKEWLPMFIIIQPLLHYKANLTMKMTRTHTKSTPISRELLPPRKLEEQVTISVLEEKSCKLMLRKTQRAFMRESSITRS